MNLLQDFRFAVRLLLKDPGFTAVAILALAIGIGLNASVFTLVNGVLIRGLPFDEPDRLMYVGEFDVAVSRNYGVSWHDFQNWREAQKTFQDLAAWSVGTMNVSDEGRPPERYNGAYFSANAFRTFRVGPVLGRDFRPEDDSPGAAPVVMLSHTLWQNRYGLDPTVVGKVVRVNEVPATVVGVMPEVMKFPDADLWLPLSSVPGLTTQLRNQRIGLQAFGRLAPGTSRQQAQSEFTGIAERLADNYVDTNKNITAHVMTFNERVAGGSIRLALLAAMGAVGFVLLIACANVASLLLARATQRAREIAVRVSIGATRGRIIRQLLVESILLAFISGTLGWMLSVAGTRWFDVVTQDAGRPFFIQFVTDRRVFGFFAAVCLSTGILFGLAPALHISRTDLSEIIKEGCRSGGGGRRARRWTSVLVVGELTLTLILLGGAGFMMRSFLNLYRLDAGIETAHLMTMNLSLPERKYPTAELRATFYQQLDERLSAIKTIRSGTIASHIPLGSGAQLRLTIDGRPALAVEQRPQVTRVTIGPRYFDTLGLTLTRGRAFTDADGVAGNEVGVVNQRFVSLFFANEDPIGRRIQMVTEPASGPEPTWITIVGISPTVRQRNLREPEPDPVVYVPYRFAPPPAISLLVRTVGAPSSITSTLREEVRALDPDLPLFGIATMDQSLAQGRLLYRVFGTMFASFGMIALLLSAMGLYAITAYAVTQRTQEIGVRMALGAGTRQVCWLIVRASFIRLGIGLTLGLAGAFGAGRLLRSLLATSPTDPLTLLFIVTVFVMVSFAACYLPARRAMRVDPIHALRHE